MVINHNHKLLRVRFNQCNAYKFADTKMLASVNFARKQKTKKQTLEDEKN